MYVRIPSTPQAKLAAFPPFILGSSFVLSYFDVCSAPISLCVQHANVTLHQKVSLTHNMLKNECWKI